MGCAQRTHEDDTCSVPRRVRGPSALGTTCEMTRRSRSKSGRCTGRRRLITQLARYELTGGEIRNVVIAAATLSAGEGRPLSMKHVDAAVRREFAKNGRVIDERLFIRSAEGIRA